MASRVTQQVVEVLTTTAPAARVTQQAVEVLRTGVVAARVTQQVVEVLTVEAGTAQLSQVVLEVLRTGTVVPAELSQVVLEVLRANEAETPLPTGEARVTQHALETVLTTSASTRVTQHLLEVLGENAPETHAHVTQHVLETLVTTLAQARVTQHVLEVLAPGVALAPPLPVVDPPDPARIRYEVRVTAEMLLAGERLFWDTHWRSDGPHARSYELVLPDGSLQVPLQAPTGGALEAVLVTSNQPLLLTLGDPALNASLALEAGGVVVLTGGYLAADPLGALTYHPGTGVAATVLVVLVGTLLAEGGA